MYNDTGQGSMLHLFLKSLTHLRGRLYCNRNGVLSSVNLCKYVSFQVLMQ